ncbi:hypothetical protein CP980_04860 [Streptomyces vinaceus]|uniref:Uncharacterized protein n=1 Tax=Streptomyces vinaceus TaxID=1960 RepID=A0A5J6JAE1_STRVI|nr:hypothetical protein [Streptomyces vinaceus]QEV44488.1 hypothetical protein CP980_04860 [Streptomyces vinaceus]GHE26577.1 hypothetical protein GCM10017778_04930 [Streptomyces vinaceus]
MATLDRMDVGLRALHLLEGQRMAQRLFAHVIATQVIKPGRSEEEVDNRIALIAREVFGVRAGRVGRRFVRSGSTGTHPRGAGGAGMRVRACGRYDQSRKRSQPARVRS